MGLPLAAPAKRKAVPESGLAATLYDREPLLLLVTTGLLVLLGVPLSEVPLGVPLMGPLSGGLVRGVVIWGEVTGTGGDRTFSAERTGGVECGVKWADTPLCTWLLIPAGAGADAGAET